MNKQTEKITVIGDKDSVIDMRVSQNDVIDMVIIEESNKIKEDIAVIRTQVDNLKKEKDAAQTERTEAEKNDLIAASMQPAIDLLKVMKILDKNNTLMVVKPNAQYSRNEDYNDFFRGLHFGRGYRHPQEMVYDMIFHEEQRRGMEMVAAEAKLMDESQRLLKMYVIDKTTYNKSIKKYKKEFIDTTMGEDIIMVGAELSKHLAGFSSALHTKVITVDFSKKEAAHKKVNEIIDKINEAEIEIKRLNNLMYDLENKRRDVKASLTRSTLETTEQGKAILENLEAVKNKVGFFYKIKNALNGGNS